MEVKEKTGSSGMIDVQRTSLSHLTGRKCVLNLPKLTCFVIVFSNQNNTILEKNTSYIRKSV